MKEATGEANMTIVTVILIAAIVAIATPIITRMMSNTKGKTCCMEAGGIWKGGSCQGYDSTSYTACMNDSGTTINNDDF